MKPCDIGYWMMWGPLIFIIVIFSGALLIGGTMVFYKEHGWKGLAGLLAVIGWIATSVYLSTYCR